jgi:hypothetical protein
MNYGDLVEGKAVYVQREPVKTPRECNRHTDCDAADKQMRAAGYPLGAEHCDDECCEECFGY